MSDLITIAGIGWDPEIRGILVVLVGCAVLLGSVWLLLATNNGPRLAALVTLAGITGWTAVMAGIWWIYGIGLVGDGPSFEVVEVNFGDVSQATTGDVSDLPPPEELPDAITLVRELGDESTQAELDSVDEEEIRAQLTEVNDLRADDHPRKLDDAQLEEAIAAEVADEEAKNEALTLSALAAVSPETIEAAALDFEGWNLLSTAEAGEAQAAADAALLEEGVFASSADFIVLDSFQQGGKPERQDDSAWERISNTVLRQIEPEDILQEAYTNAFRAVSGCRFDGPPALTPKLSRKASSFSTPSVETLAMFA